ncbi:PilZ domain-containing protein [Oceanimonas sp. MB9]|uniref:PilZ domain-containing protein n=1 Tax=Oceanimonas sp. MB9 TaxID=2588453 RepID=UPI0013F68E9D|nr:PilZ domain-containing protein [Oceanimonas sp. MB9]NHH99620.1 Cyclic diguanosine monophosphate-binding protein [Oceanimonas sp. MB9]
MAERRALSRVRFNAQARLIDAGGQEWPVEVCDLSLHGALLTRPAGWQGRDDERLELQLQLDDAGQRIVMRGRQRHHRGAGLGLECELLDMASATHLRRLVELNLGDEHLLQRQFVHLAGD